MQAATYFALTCSLILVPYASSVTLLSCFFFPVSYLFFSLYFPQWITNFPYTLSSRCCVAFCHKLVFSGLRCHESRIETNHGTVHDINHTSKQKKFVFKSSFLITGSTLSLIFRVSLELLHELGRYYFHINWHYHYHDTLGEVGFPHSC